MRTASRNLKFWTRLLTGAIAVGIACWGGFLTWHMSGKNLVGLHKAIHTREADMRDLRKEILESRKVFLAGAEADRIREQLERMPPPSECVGDLLGELRAREARGSFDLRSFSLEPPGGTSRVARVRYEMILDAPYGDVASFLAFMEEAYPANQVNRLEIARIKTGEAVRATIGGALYIPR